MADPITREQVERAMLGKTVWDVADALGTAWTDKAPQWMRTYWCRTRTGGGLVPEDIAALTRWRDELVAAETPRGWTRHSSGSYWCLHCNATGDAPGGQDCSNCGGLGWRGEPGATPEPAPEVVDVPQPAAPVVKRCDTVTASWTPGKGHLTVRTMVRDMDVPIALLRAMLEAIDAQQGGAS